MRINNSSTRWGNSYDIVWNNKEAMREKWIKKFHNLQFYSYKDKLLQFLIKINPCGIYDLGANQI